MLIYKSPWFPNLLHRVPGWQRYKKYYRSIVRCSSDPFQSPTCSKLLTCLTYDAWFICLLFNLKMTWFIYNIKIYIILQFKEKQSNVIIEIRGFLSYLSRLLLFVNTTLTYNFSVLHKQTVRSKIKRTKKKQTST